MLIPVINKYLKKKMKQVFEYNNMQIPVNNTHHYI